MRILYIPNHAVLEHDELRILSEFAESIFSVWFYSDPTNPSAAVRPALPQVPVNQRAADIWKREQLTRETCLLSDDFTSCFDIIVAVADTARLDYLLSRQDLPVVIRMIGQSGPTHEAALGARRSKCKIVRYSPAERFTPSFAGEDALVRFGKYPEDFQTWRGDNGHVTTLYSSMSRRPRHASFDEYKSITEPFPRAMFGSGNIEGPWIKPGVTYEQAIAMYSQAAVYYCCHTIPASYTLNLMEAMMTGCPIVTPGREIIRAFDSSWDLGAIYEVPDLLDTNEFKACADSVEEGQQAISRLLENPELAAQVGQRNRETALALFNAKPIAEQWRTLLSGWA